MSIVKKTPSKIVIDLDGPIGNAYALLGNAAEFARQSGYSKEKIDKMIVDMQSADYEHLVQVFDKHFGHVVTLLYSGNLGGTNDLDA